MHGVAKATSARDSGTAVPPSGGSKSSKRVGQYTPAVYVKAPPTHSNAGSSGHSSGLNQLVYSPDGPRTAVVHDGVTLVNPGDYVARGHPDCRCCTHIHKQGRGPLAAIDACKYCGGSVCENCWLEKDCTSLSQLFKRKGDPSTIYALDHRSGRTKICGSCLGLRHSARGHLETRELLVKTKVISPFQLLSHDGVLLCSRVQCAWRAPQRYQMCEFCETRGCEECTRKMACGNPSCKRGGCPCCFPCPKGLCSDLVESQGCVACSELLRERHEAWVAAVAQAHEDQAAKDGRELAERLRAEQHREAYAAGSERLAQQPLEVVFEEPTQMVVHEPEPVRVPVPDGRMSNGLHCAMAERYSELSKTIHML